eukprot:SM000148S01001  [mRNA]  locus=s148:57252:59558:+ [translate_table: standard]
MASTAGASLGPAAAAAAEGRDSPPLAAAPEQHAAPRSGGLSQYYVAVDRQQFKMLHLDGEDAVKGAAATALIASLTIILNPKFPNSKPKILNLHLTSQGTLRDLLEVLSRRAAALPVAVCVASRDALDAIATAVGGVPGVATSYLHSDQTEAERSAAIEGFRQLADERGGCRASSLAGGISSGRQALVILMTDACLPSPALGEPALSARVLINFELPVKKEAYVRRTAACLGHAAAVALARAAAASTAAAAAGGGGAATAASGGGAAGGSPAGRQTIVNFVVATEAATLGALEEALGVVMEEMPVNILELLQCR